MNVQRFQKCLLLISGVLFLFSQTYCGPNNNNEPAAEQTPQEQTTPEQTTQEKSPEPTPEPTPEPIKETTPEPAPEPRPEPVADAAPKETAPETATCENFSGLYSGKGACNPALLAFPGVICVEQTACNVKLLTAQFTLEGTATGTELKVATQVPIPQNCTGKSENGEVSVTCEAPAVGIKCEGKASKVAIQDATSTCCDTVAQNCQGTGERCTAVNINAEFFVSTACLKDTGTKDVGEGCKRQTSDWLGLGRDDCKKGLLCTNWHVANPGEDNRACRKLCHTTADCGANEGCRRLSNSAPRTGVCLPACKMDSDGSDCPTGTSCTPLSDIESNNGSNTLGLYCLTRKTGKAGDACQFVEDCEAGTICNNRVCKQACTAKLPCPTGKTCNPIKEMKSGLEAGVCE